MTLGKPGTDQNERKSYWRHAIYFRKDDPRVIVPRRIKWTGWTINFARPSAIPVLALLMGLLLAPEWIVGVSGWGENARLVALALGIGAVMLVSHYLSSR